MPTFSYQASQGTLKNSFWQQNGIKMGHRKAVTSCLLPSQLIQIQKIKTFNNHKYQYTAKRIPKNELRAISHPQTHFSSLNQSLRIQVLYYIRQMGQQQTKTQKPPRYTPSRQNSNVNSARKQPTLYPKPSKPIQCEGLLKLRTTPFKNSIQIESQTQVLFLENVETNLKTLLESRLNTNKLFMQEDIQKLIESVIFTLAFLQSKNITYRDISPQNVYYDEGCFKLLPNQLIEHSTYQKLRLDIESYPSPQLLIGLKLDEKDIEEEDILEKCNIFTFGMLMLEVSTLLPSSECYDLEGYQIYHKVLKERILMIGEYYGQKIARIIANMIDYDYEERMTLKELSIWVNRELQQEREPCQVPEPLTNSIMVSKVAEKHHQNSHFQLDLKSKVSHNNSTVHNQTKRLSKNNSVYMKPQPQPQPARQERNKIYVSDHQPQETITNNRIYTNNHNYQPSYPSRNDYTYERSAKPVEKMVYHHPGYNENEKYGSGIERKKEMRNPNPYCEEFKFPKEDRFDKENVKKISKEPVNPYRNYLQEPNEESKEFELASSGRTDKQPLRQLNNHYYPKVEDILRSKPQQRQPVAQQEEVPQKAGVQESNSICKIREQIKRSRDMLQQFRRSQRLK